MLIITSIVIVLCSACSSDNNEKDGQEMYFSTYIKDAPTIKHRNAIGYALLFPAKSNDEYSDLSEQDRFKVGILDFGEKHQAKLKNGTYITSTYYAESFSGPSGIIHYVPNGQYLLVMAVVDDITFASYRDMKYITVNNKSEVSYYLTNVYDNGRYNLKWGSENIN